MPPMVESDLTVTQAMMGLASMSPSSPIPIARNGELTGFVVRQDLDDVPFAQRSGVAVGPVSELRQRACDIERCTGARGAERNGQAAGEPAGGPWTMIT